MYLRITSWSKNTPTSTAWPTWAEFNTLATTASEPLKTKLAEYVVAHQGMVELAVMASEQSQYRGFRDTATGDLYTVLAMPISGDFDIYTSLHSAAPVELRRFEAARDAMLKEFGVTMTVHPDIDAPSITDLATATVAEIKACLTAT